MSWKNKLARIAIVTVALISLLGIGIYFALHSPSFHAYVLRKVEQTAGEAVGGKVEIENFSMHFSSVTANAYGIKIHGNEGNAAAPLLQADQLTIRLKIVSLLKRKVDLNEIIIRHPVVNLMATQDGSTNLPHPPRSSGNSASIFDFGVQHALLSGGEVYYKDAKTPLDADLHDLRLEVKSRALSNQYDGTLSYKNGTVRYGGLRPVSHDLSADFTANPSEFSLKPLLLRIGTTTLQLDGSLKHYSAPFADANYKITAYPADFRRVVNNPLLPAGEIVLAGSLHYQYTEQPFLGGLSVAGRVDSRELRADSPDVRTTIQDIRGEYKLDSGNLEVRGLEANVLGGHLVAAARIENIDTTPSGQLTAVVRSLSIEAVKRSLKAPGIAQAPLDGRVDASVIAGWTRGLDTLKARSDLTLKGSLAANQAMRNVRVPLDGQAHIDYDAARSLATIKTATVHTPATRIDLTGTAGRRLNIKADARFADLRELDTVVAALKRSGKQNEAPVTVNLAGGADAQVLVAGTTADPAITGRLNAHDLQYQSTQWKSFRTSFKAAKSGISIEDASLVSQQKGYLNLSANVGLKNWSYEPTGPVTARVKSQGLAIKQILQVANLNYPVSGDLSADLSVRGSQENPAGNGRVEIKQAQVYSEPLNELVVSFSGDGNALTSDTTVSSTAGKATAHVVVYPRNKGYEVNVKAPQINLGQLKIVAKKNLQMAGTLTLAASGRGTFDDPQLNASVDVPRLQIKQASISGIKARVGVANHQAQLTLDSEVAQSYIQARGTMALTGDYFTRATFDTKAIPIEGLAALYTTVRSDGPHGQLEVHGSAEGPLKFPDRMQAHLVIPTLNATYQQIQIANKGPVKIAYANYVVSLEPSEIAGTDTDLKMQGQLPLKGNAAMTLSAVGDVDMQLLRLLSSDLQSSGKLAMNVRASGTVGHPTLAGQIQVQNVSIVPPDSPLGVQNMNGVLDVHDDQVTITKLNGKSGGGDLSITGLIGYRPRLQANVALNAKNVRVRYQDTIRVVFDSDLNLVGTSESGNLNGRVLIGSLGFTQDFDLAQLASQFQSGSETAPPEGLANNLKLNVAVQSSRNLDVASSAVSLQGQADLRVIGTAAEPVIVGRTQLNGGDIFLMNNRYQIERGIIEFLNPSRTQPVVNLLLTTTISQYRLSLNFVGPIDKMRTNYISDPPLPTAEVINLIARGQTSEQAANNSPANFGASSLLAKGVSSGVSSGLQKLGGFSSFSIDPTLGGNDVNPGARIAFQKRVTSNFFFTFATDVTTAQREIVQGEYRFNKRWSASATRDENGGFAVDGKFHTQF